MKWREFKAMISGLGPKTPLGEIVSIRLETDPKIIKNFSANQRRINSEWQTRRAKNRSEAEVNDALEQIKQAFIRMAGTKGGGADGSDSR